MPDWVQFRSDVTAGLPNTAQLAQLDAQERWLDLSMPEALAALEEALKTVAPELLYQSMIILNQTIMREGGIPSGPDSGPPLQQLLSEVQQGTASDARKKLAAELTVLWQLFGTLLKRYPGLNQPPSPADLAKLQLQQAATGIFKRVDPVAQQMSPGTVTDLALKTYEDVIRDARSLAAGATPDNAALAYVYSMTGSAERALAKAYAIVGRHADALQMFADAAADFTKAQEPNEVADCNTRANDLRQQLSGSLDAAAEIPLEALNANASAPDAASRPAAPWERVRALMKLAEVSGAAADAYEALQYADAAAKALSDLRYPDPQSCTPDAAMDAWIRTASATLRGTALLDRVSQVCTLYDAILGARLAAIVKTSPAAADQIQALQTEIQKLAARMRKEVNDAFAESTRHFERYFPAPPGTHRVSDENKQEDFEAKLDRMRAVDAALLESQQQCNQRAAAHQPMDDLLEVIAKLEAEADTLNSPVYEAKVRLGHAYILYQLGRGVDLQPVAQEARRRLLAGRPASLSSFAQAYERYYYLDSLNREAMGCIMTGNFEGSLRICEETIRDFETQRYRVNSDYRQTSLLSYVASFYTWAAFSAFKLQRWDNMLEAIDLIKARSAIRNRLMPDSPQHLSDDLQKEFEQVSAALDADPQNEELKTKRRQLWDLQSIVGAQNSAAADAPALTVAALQAALDQDEALIGFFWLAETVILTVAVDRGRFQAQRISLTSEQLTRLNDFVEFVQELKTSHDMDKEVAKLGAILLPDFLRSFIDGKKRVILSPHHSLHLFPFHAARWASGGYLGTEFAVSYVPNFSSVLLPWSEPAQDRALVIAIRDFANHYASSLDNVEEDAAAIAASYRAAGIHVEPALGPEATRLHIEALHNDGSLRKFRCVHLGTHGLSVFESPNHPLESRLLLQDGPLDAMDLARLGLNAEVVALSACHSGQRAIQLRELGEIPGDDIFGLQAALFKSGVRAILGTLWLVETETASPITRGFHRYHAQGQPAEVALQLSIKDYLDHPVDELTGVYYWAPYFISSIGRKQTTTGESCQN